MMVQPGGTIGMVGGGQLGRMFALAASAMGFRTVVFCQDENEPAAQIAHEVVIGELTDLELATRFAKKCDVITLEFENIPAATIAACQSAAPTYPSAQVLAISQDREIEKSTLAAAGLPVTPFAPVKDAQSLTRFGNNLGWPVIIKTARSGYDGKGQYRVESAADVDQVPFETADRWVAEKCIAFDREVSVIAARNVSGQVQCFPVFENVHRRHVLEVTAIPAKIDAGLQNRLLQAATKAVHVLDVVGLLCIEFFVSGDDIMINEVAPRPHNSGHVTMEACHTSQFSQHVRAICNLPLGNPGMKVPAAAMINLLGEIWKDGPPDWTKFLQNGDASLHLYGKQSAKPGRKMGHVTMVGTDRDAIVRQLRAHRDHLERSASPESLSLAQNN
jgi:5-(carboxyamino)imidazole ribonucleotide synthase